MGDRIFLAVRFGGQLGAVSDIKESKIRRPASGELGEKYYRYNLYITGSHFGERFTNIA